MKPSDMRALEVLQEIIDGMLNDDFEGRYKQSLMDEEMPTGLEGSEDGAMEGDDALSKVTAMKVETIDPGKIEGMEVDSAEGNSEDAPAVSAMVLGSDDSGDEDEEALKEMLKG